MTIKESNAEMDRLLEQLCGMGLPESIATILSIPSPTDSALYVRKQQLLYASGLLKELVAKKIALLEIDEEYSNIARAILLHHGLPDLAALADIPVCTIEEFDIKTKAIGIAVEVVKTNKLSLLKNAAQKN